MVGLTGGHPAPDVSGFTVVTTTLPSPWVNDDTPRGNVEGPVPTSAPAAIARGLWSPSRRPGVDADKFELPSPEGSWMPWAEPVRAETTIGVIWCVL